MKKILCLLIALFGLTAMPTSWAQSQDKWSLHLAYHDGREGVRLGDWLYTLMGENLLAYHTKTTEVVTIDRLSHGLSGKRILHLGVSGARGLVVLLYADGNIDLYYPNTGTVVNIPQLRNSNEGDLVLNALRVQNDVAFVATNTGFAWIDLAKEELYGFYRLGACNDVAMMDNRVYAALTAGRVLHAHTLDNMSDRSIWQEFVGSTITSLVATKKGLFLVAPASDAKSGVTFAAATGDATLPSTRHLGHYDLSSVHADESDNVVAVGNSQILFYPEATTSATIIQRPVNGSAFIPDGKGGFWVGLDGKGFIQTPIVDNTLDYGRVQASFGGFGPRLDKHYFMRYNGTELLVAAGRLDPYDLENTPQTAMLYDGKEWKTFDTPTAQDGFVGSLFTNATSITPDPNRPGRYLVSTARTGVYDYDETTWGKISRQYTRGTSALNSPTILYNSAGGINYVRTDGVNFDAKGNLFLINNQRDTTIWVMKPDRTWKDIYIPELLQAPTLEKTMFDSAGRLWINSRRTVSNHNGGFLCLDYNGTVDNPDDDVYMYRSSLTNQDGTSYVIQGYSMAEDKDGAVWLGTDQGIFKVDNPAQWLNKDYQVTQIKVPRNDGTPYADYLLAGVAVTAIAVDGANRKWVGTQGNGVYLFSPDGVTTIHHFTTNNSPLFSNNIWSIACHPTNGEVMIATENGLLSYHSDASEPQSILSRETASVYPNPIRPGYFGPITVEGLVADADVKVTNAGGIVVANGTSVGGTFTWDGRGYDGSPVGSGIYYFHIATSDGKQAIATKVAIVR